MRIVHAADWHLDSAFGALGVEKARQRRREGRQSVERLAALVQREGADALLLSGDLFDGREVYPETLESICRALGELRARVFIAPGNHDPYGFGSAYERIALPENVHLFRSGEIEAVEWAEQNAVIYGAAFTKTERSDRPLANFSAPRDGRLHLMVLHGDVTGGESLYGAISREEIARSHLHYLALGHIHRFGGVQREGETFWAYPGCLEGRGFDETGERGALAGEVRADGVDLRFVPLAQRRYEIVTVDVTGRDAEEAVRQALPATAASDILRVRLSGETEGRGLDACRLQERLAPLCYALEVRDETRLRAERGADVCEDSLRGLFLRRMRERVDAAQTEEERLTAQEALRFGLAALEGREL